MFSMSMNPPIIRKYPIENPHKTVPTKCFQVFFDFPAVDLKFMSTEMILILLCKQKSLLDTRDRQKLREDADFVSLNRTWCVSSPNHATLVACSVFVRS